MNLHPHFNLFNCFLLKHCMILWWLVSLDARFKPKCVEEWVFGSVSTNSSTFHSHLSLLYSIPVGQFFPLLRYHFSCVREKWTVLEFKCLRSAFSLRLKSSDSRALFAWNNSCCRSLSNRHVYSARIYYGGNSLSLSPYCNDSEPRWNTTICWWEWGKQIGEMWRAHTRRRVG